MSTSIYTPTPEENAFSRIEHLQNLNAYNLHGGVDSLLDMWRYFNTRDSDTYYPLIVPFPKGVDITIAPRIQVQASLSVPPGSTLAAVSGFSSQDAGFRFSLFNRALGVDLFNAQFIDNRLFAVPLEVQLNGTTPTFGPLMMVEPFMTVVSGADLQATITNMSTSAAIIQVALWFIVPKNPPIAGGGKIPEGVSV